MEKQQISDSLLIKSIRINFREEEYEHIMSANKYFKEQINYFMKIYPDIFPPESSKSMASNMKGKTNWCLCFDLWIIFVSRSSCPE